MSAASHSRSEHRLIERVLGSLETFAVEAEGGLTVERPLLAGYAEFFGSFADACHHGKEEDDDRLHALAERLLAGFAPDAGRMAAVTASAPACQRS